MWYSSRVCGFTNRAWRRAASRHFATKFGNYYGFPASNHAPIPHNMSDWV